MCSCPAGFSLSIDNKTCEIMDYCTRHLKCSQVCEQHKNTVKCSCYEGWKLSKDGENCVSTGELKFNVFFNIPDVNSCYVPLVRGYFNFERNIGLDCPNAWLTAI